MAFALPVSHSAGAAVRPLILTGERKQMLKFLMAGVAGLVVASSAHAAAPAGGRAEAIVGWDKNKLDTGAGTLNRDGVVFGLGLGYDFVIGTTASLGIDVEASESSADVSATSGTTSAKLSIGRDL